MKSEKQRPEKIMSKKTKLDLIEDECLKHSLRYERDLAETSDSIMDTLLQSSNLRDRVQIEDDATYEDAEEKEEEEGRGSTRLSECGKRTYLKSMSTQQQHHHSKKRAMHENKKY